MLLVILDTVRADHLSAYGHERATSPNLEALARTGVRFADVTAPGNWTWPTHGSLFTGVPPWVHGADFGRGDGEVKLSFGPLASTMREELPTLAERLAAAGYRTAFLTANPVISPSVAGSLLRGFEQRRDVSDAAMAGALAAFLASGDERPAFAAVNLIGAHAPYQAHDHPWIEERAAAFNWRTAERWARPFLSRWMPGVTLYRSAGRGLRNWAHEIIDGPAVLPEPLVPILRAAYDSDLARVDAVMGVLLDRWRERTSDSVIAVSSDHGEYLGEHGLVDHTTFLYPEVLRVPLVIHAPGRLPAGRVIDAPVELQDLYGTLLELALGEPVAGSLVRLVEGGLARPLVRAEARPRSDFRTARLKRRYRLCRWGDEAVIVADDGTRELYDLASDATMSRDLAEARPAHAAARAKACRESFADAVEAPTPPVEFPEDLRNALTGLGYLDPDAEPEPADPPEGSTH